MWERVIIFNCYNFGPPKKQSEIELLKGMEMYVKYDERYPTSYDCAFFTNYFKDICPEINEILSTQFNLH